MSRPLSTLALTALLAAAASLAACGSKAGAAADSASAAAPASGAAAGAATAAPSAPDPRVSRADQNRILGDSTARLWMLVVSDFQCPYCGQWERETSRQVIDEFVKTGKVRLAFINFPLQQHPNAVPAAEAAMCAGAQGKFWEMHDRIFQAQAEWSPLPDATAFFEKDAGAIGLDAAAYKACIGEHTMRAMIFADAERARAAGANSTPSFFIGNVRLAGAEKIEAFRKAIAEAEAALAASFHTPFTAANQSLGVFHTYSTASGDYTNPNFGLTRYRINPRVVREAEGTVMTVTGTDTTYTVVDQRIVNKVDLTIA
ncbi:MAG TPA: thioredoxin domain-containing protein, partial [Gemmatimonadaceae bacterium]|nr:thioredoxin domain-containing protein [Gemmatimonadaceae bacterium]